MAGSEQSEDLPVSAVDHTWLPALGVLGRLPRIRDAAAAIMNRVRDRAVRLYQADLAQIAAEAQCPESDIRVAADLLATDRVIHDASTPEELIDEAHLLGSDLSRVRFAYVIDPDHFDPDRASSGASSAGLDDRPAANRMAVGGQHDSLDHPAQPAPAATPIDPGTQ